MSEATRRSTSPLAFVAAARVGVGVAMILAPRRFYQQGSATETLLMRTVGIRDVVLGSGACLAWARGAGVEVRRWASAGLLSDCADTVTGVASRSQIGAGNAKVAALSPVPFVVLGMFGLARRPR